MIQPPSDLARAYRAALSRNGIATASQPDCATNQPMTARKRMTSRISLAGGDVVTVDSPTWLTSKELARISGWLSVIFCIEEPEPPCTSYLGAALADWMPIFRTEALGIRLGDTL